MKKIFIFIIFTSLLKGVIHAQKIEGVAGFMKGGYMYAPCSGNILNQITPSSKAGFRNNYFLFGAEVYYRENKNIYTVEGSMGVQKRYSYHPLYAEPYCGAAHLNWGRVIAENGHFWLYPVIGAGASVIQLTTYNKQNIRVENIKEKTLVSPSLNAGMNADFLLSKPKWKEGYYYGWMLGIRVGYRAAVNSSKWTYENEVKSYDKPRYANDAFYFTLAIGGGSFDKH